MINDIQEIKPRLRHNNKFRTPQKTNFINRHKKILLVICGFFVAITIVVFYFLMQNHQSEIFSAQTLRQINFNIFIPDQDLNKQDVWIIDRQSTYYNQETKTLTIVAKKDNKEVIITEQATPEAFKDIPGQFSRMLASINQYSQQSTNLGNVALVHPKELNGGQTAVLNTRDTLIFARPNKDISDNEWQAFFNTFIILK